MPQMLGLGFANPELKRAQMLAQLNGSTAIPQGRAGGPPPISSDIPGGPQAGPVQMPAVPQQQPPMPPPITQVPVNIPQVSAPPASEMMGGDPSMDPTAQTQGIPKWAKIAGAIGHVLLSIDAGYNGRGMPGAPGYLDPSKEQDQAMQVSEFLVNTTARAWEVSRKAPPGAREKMLDQYRQAVQRVAPNFDFDGFLESMQTEAERMDELAPDLATLSEDAKRMVMSQINARGGNAQAASGVIKDEQFMAGIMDYEDQRNAPSLKSKLAMIKKGMDGARMPPDILADASPDGFRQFNENLPERHRLSPSEIGTLRRNPDLQRIIGLGRPPEMGQDPTLESRAGRTPRPRPMRSPIEDPGEEAGDEFEEPVVPNPPRTRAVRPQPTTRAAPSAPPSQQRRRPQGDPNAKAEPSGNAFLDGLVDRGYEAQKAMRARGVTAEEFVPKARAVADRMNQYLDDNPEADRYPTEQDRRPPAPPRQARRPAQRPPPEDDYNEPTGTPVGGRSKPMRLPSDQTLPGLGKVKKGEIVVGERFGPGPLDWRYQRVKKQ